MGHKTDISENPNQKESIGNNKSKEKLFATQTTPVLFVNDFSIVEDKKRESGKLDVEGEHVQSNAVYVASYVYK